MFHISVNLEDTKKVDHIMENKRRAIFFDVIYVIYPLSEIEDNIQGVFQFPCLLGHLV